MGTVINYGSTTSYEWCLAGILICISFHLRSRRRQNTISRRPPISSFEKRRNAGNASRDVEMFNMTDSQTKSQSSHSGWIPHLKYFRSQNLRPEPFTLTPPARTSPPSTPIIIVERFPPPSKAALNDSNTPDPASSSLSPMSPPAYVPSKTSSIRRALPSPPSSHPSSPVKSPRSPSVPKKKLEIATGSYPPETIQSPPPAYKQSRGAERPISRSISATNVRSSRRPLPRRPSTSGMSAAIASPVSPSSPTASSSRHVLSMALQSDSKRLPRLMTVAQTFVPTFPDEVSVTSGDAVLLLEEYGDSWCLVQLLATSTARRGVVPLSCLQEYVDDDDDEPSL